MSLVKSYNISWYSQPVTVEAIVHDDGSVQVFNMTFDTERDKRGQPIVKTFAADPRNEADKVTAFSKWTATERESLYSKIRAVHARLVGATG